MTRSDAGVTPPSTWLVRAAGPERHGIVIRWGWEPEWLAPLPCGVRWDVLALTAELGLTVLKELRASDAGAKLGPVLHDHDAGLTYWLLPVEANATTRWQEVDPTAQLLPSGTHLMAPDPEPETARPSTAEWVHWPAVTGTLTPPSLLAAAVVQALRPA